MSCAGGRVSRGQQRGTPRVLMVSGEYPPALGGVGDYTARLAQALLISAVHLAGSAGQIRREATIAEDIARAWDASSAAAGALMLGAQARTEMQRLLRPPELR